MRFLSRQQVCALIQLSKASIGRLEDDPASDFPQSVKLGTFRNSRVVYVESEILDWMSRQVAQRDKTH